MIILPNNCQCSDLSVFPKNWKTPKASVKIRWRIQYYFSDGNIKKLIVVKRMNRIKTLRERYAFTKILLEHELERLQQGYNPITRKKVVEKDVTKMPFIQALQTVFEKLNCVPTTKSDIRSTIKFVEIAALKLHFDSIPIGEIKRKHIKRILDYCAETKEIFTALTYNRYRKNLGILFKELVEIEAIETNIIRDISKQKTIRKIKRILTPAECKKVSDFAREYDRRFYLLIHIFFHSGCRTSEIFRVKRKHVNLEDQTLKITVLKGNQPFEVEKPIKDIAVEFWSEAIKGAGEEDFIFSKGLEPGAAPINPRQATRRWRLHIKGDKQKGKLGITSSWYSLKHLNTDQITKERGLKVAGKLNSHTNEETTRIYAVGEDERMNEEIKKMKNAFG